MQLRRCFLPSFRRRDYPRAIVAVAGELAKVFSRMKNEELVGRTETAELSGSRSEGSSKFIRAKRGVWRPLFARLGGEEKSGAGQPEKNWPPPKRSRRKLSEKAPLSWLDSPRCHLAPLFTPRAPRSLQLELENLPRDHSVILAASSSRSHFLSGQVIGCLTLFCLVLERRLDSTTCSDLGTLEEAFFAN